MKANEEYGKFTGPGEVRLVRTLPGPIERVWAYLTDPEKRARWFAGGPMEQRAGGKMNLVFRHADLAPHETTPAEYREKIDGCDCAGVVTRCEPPRVLAYTFGQTQESEVTFELTPQGREVLLVLTHRARGADIPHITNFASGWHAHLTHLAAELAGDAHPPFWSLHARLKSDYDKLQAGPA